MDLNEKYRIVYDPENVILQFHEMREKQILITEEGKKAKTFKGTGEFKEYTENFYYPELESALRGFLKKSTWEIESVEEIIKKLEEVRKTIKNINLNK